MKKKTIHIDVYDQDVTFLLGDFEECDEWLKKKFDIGTQLEKRDVAASLQITLKDKSSRFVIYLKEYDKRNLVDISVMAHECFHITSKMFRNIGTPHTEDTEEPYAYLFDCIFLRALKFYSK